MITLKFGKLPWIGITPEIRVFHNPLKFLQIHLIQFLLLLERAMLRSRGRVKKLI